MRCASFFAGVGGIDLGFYQAGFKIIYANEIDNNAIKTFELNNNITVDKRSICDIDDREIPNFDIMLAGFPCQAFSIAGYRKGFSDRGRGDLFFELERIFKAKQPKVIFLENVKNLITHDNGKTFKVIKEALQNNGYYVHYQVLNSAEYANVPQNRERIYIVCFKDLEASKKFNFPPKIALTKKIKDMLIDEKFIHKNFFYDDKVAFYSMLVENATNSDTLYQWRRKYVRENKNNLCPTLTANMGTGGHNVPLIKTKNNAIRKLTPRECFNFQGFPKDFKLPEIANCHLYKQAGNSVVVPLINKIAQQIILALQP